MVTHTSISEFLDMTIDQFIRVFSAIAHVMEKRSGRQ